MARGLRGTTSDCSKCKKPKGERKARYCLKCTAEWQRNYRKRVKLTGEQKFKDNVRRKTNMRVKRGLLQRKPCEKCGELKVEAHHEDYNQPYQVNWLCRKHHLDRHKEMKTNATKQTRMGQEVQEIQNQLFWRP